MRLKYILLGAFLVIAALALAACGGSPGPTEEASTPTQAPCPTAAPCPDCPACPEPVVEDVPFEGQWAGSAHADAEAEAFVHWDEEDPAEVPVECARCHSTPGYLDWLGEDGTAPGEVNNPAPIGTVVTCTACHNQSAANLDAVPFPSGVVVDVEDPADRCAVCHQGRASMVQVNEAIEELGLTDDQDTPNAELGFVNIHYYAAAATLYGSVVNGGYEYEGQEYEGKFDHVEGFDTCTDCHSSHTLEVRVDQCADCHTNVASVEDVRNVRMAGSLRDYDGDGDIEEGIYYEVQGLQELLLQNIQTYAAEVAGTPIAYDSAAYPYFFIDTNADGQAGEDEAVFPNAYNAWTARLLKAAYNYQTSLKDPGSYAHNGKYIIQLLHDSIVSLNEAIDAPVDLAAASRLDAGHFAGSQEAFRHWDEEEGGLVPGTCSKCHTAAGLPMFLENNTTIALPASSGLNCATCHDDLATFTRFTVEEVRMPSGAVVSFDNPDSNLCLQCHQGRESKVSVDQAISRVGVGDDEVSEDLAFRNPHYFAAGATVFGDDAMGAYQYDGQEYNGRFLHVEPFNTCIECHDAHNLNIRVEGCAGCHAGVETQEDLITIRLDQGQPVDYDSDGDVSEGVAGEVQTMHEALFAAIQEYAANVAGTPIQYNPARYPYFFADPNANNQVDEGEERYVSWTPTLLRAAYNYQWVAKDPGAFAHNPDYIMQVLYDSLQDLGADVSGMTRPEVVAQPEAEGGQ